MWIVARLRSHVVALVRICGNRGRRRLCRHGVARVGVGEGLGSRARHSMTGMRVDRA
jgi:hypothetical protein